MFFRVNFHSLKKAATKLKVKQEGIRSVFYKDKDQEETY